MVRVKKFYTRRMWNIRVMLSWTKNKYEILLKHIFSSSYGIQFLATAIHSQVVLLHEHRVFIISRNSIWVRKDILVLCRVNGQAGRRIWIVQNDEVRYIWYKAWHDNFNEGLILSASGKVKRKMSLYWIKKRIIYNLYVKNKNWII